MGRSLIPFLERPWDSKSKHPAILLEIFLYGVHLVMFGSCLYLLTRRHVTPRKLLAASSALFLLATADVIITLYFFFHFVLPKDLATTGIPLLQRDHKTWNEPLKIKFGFYVVANAIASGFLVHRCYEVWRNKRIVIAPIALIVVGTVLSFATISIRHLRGKLSATIFITSAAANLSMTLLIAIRSYWTSRKARAFFSLDLTRISQLVILLLVDSGALYSLSVFFFLVFHTLVISASLTQIAGLSITAIILRNGPSDEALSETTTANVDNAPQLQSDVRSECK